MFELAPFPLFRSADSLCYYRKVGKVQARTLRATNFHIIIAEFVTKKSVSYVMQNNNVMTAIPQIALLCTATSLYYYSTFFHLDQILKVRTRLGGECLRINTSINDSLHRPRSYR